MGFSCCSKYLICSEKGFCINEIPGLKEKCNYRKKLEQGINFFKAKNNTDETYIIIDNRMLYISKCNSYGFWSYILDEEDKEQVKKFLCNESIEITDYIKKDKCVDELVSNEDPAFCKVILTIKDNKYIIHNYNIRGLKESTSIHIRDILRNKGFLAAVEYVGNRLSYMTQEYKKNQKNKVIKEEQKIIPVEVKNKVVQISMFDILKSNV